MHGYTSSTYGNRIADIYDQPGQTPVDADRAAAFLHDLAARAAATGGGEPPRVLEWGVGTGRVAIPLAALGCDVAGVDTSEAMLARCRAAMLTRRRTTEAGGRLRLSIGDMTGIRVDGAPFHVVYAAFNTLLHLLTQEEQVAAFANSAAQLGPGGAVVVQVNVPDVGRLRDGQQVRVFEVETAYVDLNITLHDPVRQQLRTQQMIIKEGGAELRPLMQRYVWPSELDLMARLAGLRLTARYADWTGTPFTAESTEHVSVYRPAEER
ncbi:class I SAM-dependent methyltransferase [Plantactinospora endophytica]|uniref:Methyltransferase n=1 Tax=Plantactinospora endophytica TaxID=673535 RepID=A0ABQ4E714_9ACTN|nr:class I SAM-dependent methyltransferase [Plantactinospora endophytica]GIG90508.1 methyltransferase [Plantactinospora endophytica]